MPGAGAPAPAAAAAAAAAASAADVYDDGGSSFHGGGGGGHEDEDEGTGPPAAAGDQAPADPNQPDDDEDEVDNRAEEHQYQEQSGASPPAGEFQRDDAYEWLLIFLMSWATMHRIFLTAIELLLAALRIFFTLQTATTTSPDDGQPVRPLVVGPRAWPRKLEEIAGLCQKLSVPTFERYSVCSNVKCGYVGHPNVAESIRRLGCPRPSDRGRQPEPQAHAAPDGVVPMECDDDEEKGSGRPVAAAASAAAAPAAAAAAGPSRCGSPHFKPGRPNPLTTFPYMGVERGLARLLSVPGLEAECERWRTRYSGHPLTRTLWQGVQYDEFGFPVGVGPTMSDIYDGALWEQYMYLDDQEKPFLEEAVAARLNRQVQHARFRCVPEAQVGVTHREAFDALHPADAPPAFYRPSAGDRRPLLAEAGTLALQLNIDWFQAYKHGGYSIGGVYLCVLNLPREKRYLNENMLLIGLLPGPKSTNADHQNSALKPFVDEINKFCRGQGVTMPTATSPHGRPVRAFLFNICCDTPARTAVIGCMGPGAKRGRAHCTQEFASRDGKAKAYIDSSWSATIKGSGGDWMSPPNTDASHRLRAGEWERARDEPADARAGDKAADAAATRLGSRYTTLMDIPSLDTVRGAPVDVMHNISLGIVKALYWALFDSHSVPVESTAAAAAAVLIPQSLAASDKARLDERLFVKEYTAKTNGDDLDPMITLPAVLPEKLQSTLQGYMDACQFPPGVGRFPRKIGSKSASFTAAEWASWASTFAVPHFIELRRTQSASGAVRFTDSHLQLYVDLQHVVVMVQSYRFTPADVLKLEGLLFGLLQRAEDLFGAGFIKPNQHLSLHLGAMIMDLGPPAGWACFGYERWNKLIRNVPVNPAHPELSMMRRAHLLISAFQKISVRVDQASMQPEAQRERCRAPRDLPGGGTALVWTAGLDDYKFIWKMMFGLEAIPIAQADSVSSVGRTRHGRRIESTTFADADALFRAMQRMGAIGSEPFAGSLRDRAPDIAFMTTKAAAHHVEFIKYIRPGILIQALAHHYGVAYEGDLLAIMTASQRQAHDAKSLSAQAEALRLPMPLRPEINIFRTLSLNGETYGSGGSVGKNSHFWAWFNMSARGGADRWVPAYGVINFFFVHSFLAPTQQDERWVASLTPHSFACVDWYEALDQKRLKVLVGTAVSRYQWTPNLLDHHPYLKVATDAHVNRTDRIIPVQSIAGRWIPAKRRDGTETIRAIQPIPIPHDMKHHT